MTPATLEVFRDETFDILVIGGGIYGLMAAREAASRGLRTALIEAADFGHATSHNSLKLMHGGIRYVQHLDFSRLRASARERSFWQRAAPTLVRPLEFTIPLFGHGIKGPEAFGAAALLYTIASAGVRSPEYPAAFVVGRTRAQQRLGTFAPEGLTGGGVWRDGQIQDVNRLHLACLRAGIDAGLLASNYMEATALIHAEGRVCGARVSDHRTGAQGEIRAKVTLSCTGAKAAALAQPVLEDKSGFPNFLRATNLVVDRDIGQLGLGVVSRSQSDAVVDRGGRMYFLTPWQGRTIVGTHEAPSQGQPRDSGDIDDFLEELSLAAPSLALTAKDILWVHQGMIPADVDDAKGAVSRQTRGSLIDHAVGGLGGLISVAGVKYTTARLIAERAVTGAARQLDKPVPVSSSLHDPLPVEDATDPDPDDAPGLEARMTRAMTSEMAVCLRDVIERRTMWGETGVAADPSNRAALEAAAQTLGMPQDAPATSPGTSPGGARRHSA